jgi:hypothetical protein
MFRTWLIRTVIEVSAKVFDTVEIGTDSCFGEVAAAELLKS